MAERRVKSNGIELWTESFGTPGDPAVLLVMGASAQGIRWPDELIGLLVAGGRYVIRYDHRDTGQSACFDFQRNPYTLEDLAADAVGVLDAYGITAAHLVGASLGGMICQLVSILHPERVLSLTSMMSMPLKPRSVEEIEQAIAPRVVEVFMAAASHPPTNREETIDFQVKLARALAGSAAPFDEQDSRQLETRVFDRARNPASAANHSLVPSPTREQAEALKRLRVPTLVIHGTDDPMFSPAQGAATAEAIPGARLLVLEGMGHDFPRPLLAALTRALLAHTGGEA